ncbi:MAG: gliding motility-associated C-terminal domain-containing protein [Bacteroidales bacterium]|nr:gliding motility-associated C-terminal domain-containing protein [Bacteroidales bacterium]
MYIIIAFISIIDSHSQFITVDNRTGIWSDTLSWADFDYPDTYLDSADVECFGYISSYRCLRFNNGRLVIHDTLVIYSGLTLDNNEILEIDSGGVLIVLGDYLSRNQVEVYNNGYLVVAGEFTMLGVDNQGLFRNMSFGEVYLFDSTPEIKRDIEYADLYCTSPDNYPAQCGYGNETDLNNSNIGRFFNSLNYDPGFMYDCNAFNFTVSSEVICMNDAATFYFLGNTDNDEALYVWNFGEGAEPETATGFGPFEVMYNSEGTKNIQLSRDSLAVIKEDLVEVFPAVTLSLSDTSLCGEGKVALTAQNVTGHVVYFSLDMGATLFDSLYTMPYQTEINLEDGEEINIYALGIDTITGCNNHWTDSARIISILTPQMQIISDTGICGEGAVTLTAQNVTGQTVYFSLDMGTTIYDSSFAAPYQTEISLAEGEEIIIHALCIDTITGCNNNWSDSSHITSFSVPQVQIIGDTILCNDDDETYYLEDTYLSYEWHDGSTAPDYTTDRAELIYVSVVDDNYCEGFDSILLRYCDKPGEEEVFTFTPNGDGINDYWIIKGIENYPLAKVMVFDKAGRKVYNCAGNYQNNWDGSKNGSTLPLDSYYFLIDYSSYNLRNTLGIITILH